MLILLTAYLSVLFFTITACDTLIDCPTSLEDRFKVIDLTVDFRSVIKDTVNDKLDLQISIFEEDSIDYESLGILLDYERVNYISEVVRPNHFNFIQTAYACTPVEPTSDEAIDSIKIFSAQDFDKDHPAGTDLSDLFHLFYRDFSTYEYKQVDLDEFEPLSYNNIFNTTLMLKSAPELVQEYSFLVKYYQNGIDFDYFEKETESIVIKD